MAEATGPINMLNIIREKILADKTLHAKLAIWKFKQEKIVFTNGCFDILHQGHIDYLSKAADLGKRLIVGLNSDDSVRRLGKGKSRPIQDEQSRALILASLHFVDAVVIFNEDTPLELITEIVPNVLVKGSDYEVEKIVGYSVVKANGGEVKTIDFLDGYSTSSIEEKIKNV